MPTDPAALLARFSALPTLRDYCGLRPLRGVLTQRPTMTHAGPTDRNDPFIISTAKRDELIAADPRSAEIIRPYLRGRDVQPWRVVPSGDHLIVSLRGIDIERYPAVLTHLELHRDRIGPTASGLQWYELRDSIGHFPAFALPKIVWAEMCDGPRFAMDRDGHVLGGMAYTLPVEDYFVLGVLMSSTAWRIIQQTAPMFRTGAGDIRTFDSAKQWWRLTPAVVNNLPVPTATEVERAEVADLARQCLEMTCEKARAKFQSEIDARVMDLFGLTDGERALIAGPPTAEEVEFRYPHVDGDGRRFTTAGGQKVFADAGGVKCEVGI